MSAQCFLKRFVHHACAHNCLNVFISVSCSDIDLTSVGGTLSASKLSAVSDLETDIFLHLHH